MHQAILTLLILQTVLSLLEKFGNCQQNLQNRLIGLDKMNLYTRLIHMVMVSTVIIRTVAGLDNRTSVNFVHSGDVGNYFNYIPPK